MLEFLKATENLLKCAKHLWIAPKCLKIKENILETSKLYKEFFGKPRTIYIGHD